MSEEADPFENYETGPFCRHFSDPADCDIKCASCGHRCTQHDFESPGPCDECECKAWAEPQ